MGSKKRPRIRIMVLAFLVLAACGDSQSSSETAAAGVARTMLEHVRLGQFVEASHLFHFPERYSISEIEEDKRVIVKQLRKIALDLGALDQAVEVAEHGEITVVSVGSGTVEYWSQLPNFGVDGSIRFEVVYSKFGPGVVRVRLHKSGDVWKVRLIEFGVAQATGSGAEEIRSIGLALMRALGRTVNGGIEH